MREPGSSVAARSRKRNLKCYFVVSIWHILPNRRAREDLAGTRNRTFRQIPIDSNPKSTKKARTELSTLHVSSPHRQGKGQVRVNLVVLGSEIGQRKLFDDHFVRHFLLCYYLLQALAQVDRERFAQSQIEKLLQ